MFRGNSNKALAKREVYFVQNPDLEDLIKQASKVFKVYKEDIVGNGGLDALSQSIEQYQTAVSYAKNPSKKVSLTDRAYCNRKYASIIIRDTSMPNNERYHLAKHALVEAVSGYKKYLELIQKGVVQQGTAESVILTELQRAYALQCHVAMELKNGSLLSQNAHNLLNNVMQHENPLYKLDALTYLYIAQFASSNIMKAKFTLNSILRHIELYQLNSSTDFRHLAKINLVLLQYYDIDRQTEFFKNNIQALFWKAFDPHKEEYFSKLQIARQNEGVNFHRENQLLLKDFMFLFVMKLIQRLNNIPDNKPQESVIEYTIRQIHAVYGNKKNPDFIRPQEIYIRNKLSEKTEKIRNEGKISFSYKFFPACEPPAIMLSEENLNGLLPDSHKL